MWVSNPFGAWVGLGQCAYTMAIWLCQFVTPGDHNIENALKKWIHIHFLDWRGTFLTRYSQSQQKANCRKTAK